MAQNASEFFRIKNLPDNERDTVLYPRFLKEIESKSPEVQEELKQDYKKVYDEMMLIHNRMKEIQCIELEKNPVRK